MDPRYTGEILKHLEKQNDLLKNAYNSMSHELHKLQVEEEMLMRKFYDLMAAQGLSKKEGEGSVFLVQFPTGSLLFGVSRHGQRKLRRWRSRGCFRKEGSNNVSDGGQRGQSTASLADISDGGIDRHSSAIVPFTTTDEQ